MEEIAQRFQEEYTELLSRYKEHLSNAQIMSILQSVTRKQIGFKDNPERFKNDPELKKLLQDTALKECLEGEFRCID